MARGGINKVILIGNLGQDPEVRYMPNGTAVTNLSIATSESWRDKTSGEQKELTEWHRIVLYRRLAEIAGEYLRKGAKIYIEGRLRTRKWQDQNGQDRYTTEVQADELQMLDGRSSHATTMHQSTPGRQPQEQYGQPSADFLEHTAKEGAPAGNEPLVDFDDSIPF